MRSASLTGGAFATGGPIEVHRASAWRAEERRLRTAVSRRRERPAPSRDRDGAAQQERSPYQISWCPRDDTPYNSVSPSGNHQTIVVLDFGSQFTQLIARRLRELSVYSEILPFNTPLAEIARAQSGRDHPVGRTARACREAGAPRCDAGVFDAGVPVLGICYGMQLMTDALGGEVAPAPHREFGLATITHRARRAAASRRCPPSCASGRATAISSKPAPPGFTVTATSANAPVAAMADEDRALLCAALPPGSRAHRSRHRDPAQLRLRRLRLHGRLDDGVVRRGSGRRGSARRSATGGSSAA